MREIRPSGSEGGVGLIPHPYPYRSAGRPVLSFAGSANRSLSHPAE